MLRLAAFGLGLIHTRSDGQPKPGAASRIPAVHLDHAVIDVEAEVIDEPKPELAEGQAVAHRKRSGADEALPPGLQGQPFDRPAGGIWPVEHPHALAGLGRSFEHIEQRRDEGVDPAADVLEVDEDGVERAQRLAARTADLAVEAEHRDIVDRVGEVVGLDHIVLLVAPEAVLRPEGGGDIHACGDQGVEAVREVLGNRCRMSEKRDALAVERPAQFGVGKEAIDSEEGHEPCLRKPRDEATGVVEVWLFRRVRERPIGFGAVFLFDHGASPSRHFLSASTPIVAPTAHQVKLSSIRI